MFEVSSADSAGEAEFELFHRFCPLRASMPALRARMSWSPREIATVRLALHLNVQGIDALDRAARRRIADTGDSGRSLSRPGNRTVSDR